MYDEAEEVGTMFANGITFCRVTSFEKYLNTNKTLRTSLFFRDRRKMLAIMTMFGTGDDIALSANVPLERNWKTSQKINYLDQLLYTGIQTRHIMALNDHIS